MIKKAPKTAQKRYLGGMKKIILNEVPNKIRQLEIFTPQTGYSVSALQFITSDLGRLWQKIPFEQLAEAVCRRLMKQVIHVPRWGYLDIRGGIAIEVLKRYQNGLSDEKVIENLNLCSAHRWFCFMNLPMRERIADKDLLVRWRQFLGGHLDTEALNRVLLQAWQGEIAHKHVRMSDATVYEVKIAYPQSVVLLYDACNWVYKQYSQLSASLGLGKQKSAYRKFKEQHKRQTNWSKTRKKTHKKTHKKTQGRKRELLYWLKKGLDLLKDIWVIYKAQVVEGLQRKIPPRHEKRYQTIKKLYEQQQTHFTAVQAQAESKIPDRIVSLNQPHIRPIVRGKTNKPVEFGPKVNILRIGCVSLIEHSSFNAFHEGNRMSECCIKYTHITGKCQQFAGDAIYATNANRRFASQNNIQTSFIQKGKKKNDPLLQKQEKTLKKELKKELGKVRSTHLEGSFGNQKQHYAANKITAKTPETQNFALFAALLTANAMALVNQNNKKEAENRKKQNTQNKKAKPQARAA